MQEEDINMPKWQFFLPEMRGYNDIFCYFCIKLSQDLYVVPYIAPRGIR